MKKYITRFLVAILAFFIGTATIYFFAWDNIKTLNSYNATNADHSAENNSSYSVLEGTTVRIKPYDAIFEISESWLTPKNISGEPTKNFYLSRRDLNELERFDFNHRYGFDRKDAEVMRSAFPFENCAAHVGDRAWGNSFTGDLQARVFVIDLNSQEITEKIKNRGLAKALSVFDKAELASGSYGAWEKQKLSVLEMGSHTLLFKDLDFYYRSFGNKTVVFVFIHQSGWDKAIEQILNSFKWTKSTAIE